MEFTRNQLVRIYLLIYAIIFVTFPIWQDKFDLWPLGFLGCAAIMAISFGTLIFAFIHGKKQWVVLLIVAFIAIGGIDWAEKLMNFYEWNLLVFLFGLVLVMAPSFLIGSISDQVVNNRSAVFLIMGIVTLNALYSAKWAMDLADTLFRAVN